MCSAADFCFSFCKGTGFAKKRQTGYAILYREVRKTEGGRGAICAEEREKVIFLCKVHNFNRVFSLPKH